MTKRAPSLSPAADPSDEAGPVSSAPITRPAPRPAGIAPGTEVRVRARLLRIRPNGIADLQLLTDDRQLVQIPADAIVED